MKNRIQLSDHFTYKKLISYVISPVMMGIGSIGYMLGTGGSAIVAQMLGEGKRELANSYFSMFIYVTAGVSLLLSIIGFLCVRPISAALGAYGDLLAYCVVYGRILFISQTGFILQNVFQSFFRLLKNLL